MNSFKALAREINLSLLKFKLNFATFFTCVSLIAIHLVNSAMASSLPQVSLNLHSLSYSEASPVYQMYKNKWRDAPKSDGNYAFNRTRLTLSADYQYLSFGYLERLDLNTKFSPDAAKLIYLMAGKHQLPINQTYQAKLKLNLMQAKGLFLSARTPKWLGFQLGAKFSFLTGKQLQYGDINGNFTQTADKEFKVTTPLNYHYSKDLILEHDKNGLLPSLSSGSALDLNLSWQGEKLAINFLVEDAYMQMNWARAGYLNGEVDLSFEEGKSHNFAAFSGVRGHRPLKQTFSTYYLLTADYQLNPNWSLLAQASHYYNFTFASLGGGYKWQSSKLNHYLSSQLEVPTKKVTFHYQVDNLIPYKNNTLGITLGSNTLNPKNAHHLELGLTNTWQW